MNVNQPPRRLPKSRIIVMVVIDVVALVIGVSLFLWLQPRDQDAAVLGLISSLVIGGFFNLVIALVSLKP